MKPTNKEAFARLLILRGLVIHAIATPGPMLSELCSKWSEKERNEFAQRGREQSGVIVKDLKDLGVWKYVSPNEAKYFQSYGINMNQKDHLNAIWRKECIVSIMWSLGLRETWPMIDQEALPELLKSIPVKKIGLFTQLPILRPQSEIEIKRALMEAWHWRVRTRKLIEEGQPFPSDEGLKKAGFNSYDDIVRFSAKNHLREGDLNKIIDEDFPFREKAFRSLDSNEYQLATSIIMERHYAMNWLCGMAPGNRWDDTPTPT
jgi:hypothetical protein